MAPQPGPLRGWHLRAVMQSRQPRFRRIDRDGVPGCRPRLDMDWSGTASLRLCLPKCPTFASSSRGRQSTCACGSQGASLGSRRRRPGLQSPLSVLQLPRLRNACRRDAVRRGDGDGAGVDPPQNRRGRRCSRLLTLLPHPRRLRIAAGSTARRALCTVAVRRSGAWKLLPLGKFAAFSPWGTPSGQAALQGPAGARNAAGARRLLTGCTGQMFHGTIAGPRRPGRNAPRCVSLRGCCGALAPRRRSDAAERLAAQHDASSHGLEAVIVNAAGCGST